MLVHLSAVTTGQAMPYSEIVWFALKDYADTGKAIKTMAFQHWGE
jgi:hypothetical protein